MAELIVLSAYSLGFMAMICVIGYETKGDFDLNTAIFAGLFWPLFLPLWAGIKLRHRARTKGTEADMPTIWEDQAGKGYPCFERPMTPTEAKAALDRQAARIIELEAELARAENRARGQQ